MFYVHVQKVMASNEPIRLSKTRALIQSNKVRVPLLQVSNTAITCFCMFISVAFCHHNNKMPLSVVTFWRHVKGVSIFIERNSYTIWGLLKLAERETRNQKWQIAKQFNVFDQHIFNSACMLSPATYHCHCCNFLKSFLSLSISKACMHRK